MGENGVISSMRRESRNLVFTSNESQAGKGSECSFLVPILCWALSVAPNIPHFFYIILSGTYNEARFTEQTEALLLPKHHVAGKL